MPRLDDFKELVGHAQRLFHVETFAELQQSFKDNCQRAGFTEDQQQKVGEWGALATTMINARERHQDVSKSNMASQEDKNKAQQAYEQAKFAYDKAINDAKESGDPDLKNLAKSFDGKVSRYQNKADTLKDLDKTFSLSSYEDLHKKDEGELLGIILMQLMMLLAAGLKGVAYGAGAAYDAVRDRNLMDPNANPEPEPSELRLDDEEEERFESTPLLESQNPAPQPDNTDDELDDDEEFDDDEKIDRTDELDDTVTLTQLGPKPKREDVTGLDMSADIERLKNTTEPLWYLNETSDTRYDNLMVPDNKSNSYTPAHDAQRASVVSVRNAPATPAADPAKPEPASSESEKPSKPRPSR